MNKSYRSINIFVSHPFVPKNSTYNLKQFRSNIKSLITKAGNIVKKEHQDFEIKIVFDFNDFYESLPQQIETNIRNSHFAIVDITENKANIFYECGLLYGLNIPMLIIKGKKSLNKFPIPSDIKNRLVIDYKDGDELIRKCLENVADQFRRLLHHDSLSNIYISKIWFPKDVPNIHIITSSEPTKRPEFSSPDSANYMFLENLGDKDSLLEIVTFLNRTYRNVNVALFAADNYSHNLEGNLVLIGGPGETTGDANHICKIMMEKMKLKIHYSNDCEKLIYKSTQFKATKKGKQINLDYGYFARFPNPFNPATSVILVNGIHTFGVLGAAMAFSDHPAAQGNIRKVMEKLNLPNIKQASFECFFPVEVSQQMVSCPTIDEKFIIPIKGK
jgi:hypothetical protein